MTPRMKKLRAVLALVLSCTHTVASGSGRIQVVVGIDLTGFYFAGRVSVTEAPFALAYLLHDPGVRVVAVAVGFSKREAPWYLRLLTLHPCKAAERFLQEVARSDVPVVCGDSGGSFLGASGPQQRLAGIVGALGERAVTWVALDSWSGAAAATALGSAGGRFLHEVVLPAPAPPRQGALRLDPTAGVIRLSTPGDWAAAAALGRWQQKEEQQEAAAEGSLPRLALVWRANGTRLPSLRKAAQSAAKRCPGTWLATRARTNPLLRSGAFEGVVAAVLTTGMMAWFCPRGLVEMMFPHGETSLAAAISVSRRPGSLDGPRSCLSLPMRPGGGAEQGAPAPCEPRGSDPEQLRVHLREVLDDEGVQERILEVLCLVGAEPAKTEL